MKLHWNTLAFDQLQQIRDELAINSPEYAAKVANELIEKSQQLLGHPRLGRMVPESNLPQIREVFVGKYRLIYCISDFYLEILTVIHQAQRR